jgi:hypothetical protein
LVLATTLMGAAAAALEDAPDGVVDDEPVDEVEPQAASTRVVAARAPTAAIQGRKRGMEVLRSLNGNENRFR